MFHPFEEGISHINCFSQAKTVFGKWASNFALSPFIMNNNLRYASVEAAWYWFSLDKDHAELRNPYGNQAKTLGKVLRQQSQIQTSPAEHQAFVRKALAAKVYYMRFNNPQIQVQANILLQKNIPFVHYLNFGGKIVERPQDQWIFDHLKLCLSKSNEDLIRYISSGAF